MNVGLLSSVSALAIVGYTGAVIFNGNLMAMLTQLTKDWSFIEVPIAVGLLYALYRVPVLREPVGIIVGLTLLAVSLKLFTNSNATTAVSQFASGATGLLSTFLALGSDL